MTFDLIMQQIILTELKDYLTENGENAEERLEALPSFFDKLILHGQLACHHDHTEKAIRSFRECLGMRPESFRANSALGRIYMCQGKTEQACHFLEKSALIRPNDIKALIAMLEAMNRQGQNNAVTTQLANRINNYVRKTSISLGMPLDPDTVFGSPNDSCGIGDNLCIESAFESYRNNKYVILRSVLTDQYHELIRRQQEDLMTKRKMGFQKSMNRYGLTDPPIAVLANYKLCRVVSKIIQKDVIPTYAFGIHYLPGGSIEPHYDRPQNELSMTLSLSVFPPESITTLGAGEGDNARLIDLSINDALFYRGCEVCHFRNPLPEGHTVDQMIFGFRTIHESHCYCN